jgi:hypothetical protein
MHRAILDALEEAQRFREQSEHQTPHPDLQQPLVPGRDYSYTLSAEARQRLDRMHTRWSQVAACLQVYRDTLDFYPGSPSDFFITWSSAQDQVVVELSWFGNLAAVFTYGIVPAQILATVTICLNQLGLSVLQQEDIQELEQNGAWQILFES